MIKRGICLSKKIFLSLYLYIKNKVGVKTTTCKLDSGELFVIRNIDRVGKEILNNTFESTIQEVIMSKVKPGMTVLDIGANIGFYTVKMANKVGESGRVLAFEPNPEMIKQLKCNILINNFRNVVIDETGLSDNAGVIQFHSPKPGHEAHGSFMSNGTFETDSIINIKTEKLDEALQRLNINKVDFIKIDVEGAERKVFSGASLLLSSEDRPVIIFECAELTCKSFGHHVFDVLSELVKYGYEVEEFEFGNWLASPAQKPF